MSGRFVTDLGMVIAGFGLGLGRGAFPVETVVALALGGVLLIVGLVTERRERTS